MKKKLENYILKKVIGGVQPVITDGEYIFYNDTHKVLQCKEQVGTLIPKQSDSAASIRNNFFENIDARMVELPSIKEIERGIRSCETRERVGVRITKDSPLVNARWLRDAMQALSAKVMYVNNQCSTRIAPIWLFENDDLQSEHILMMLPINTWTEDEFSGYTVCPQ